MQKMSQFIKQCFHKFVGKNKLAKFNFLFLVYFVYFKHLKLTIFYHFMTIVKKYDNLLCHILNSVGKWLRINNIFVKKFQTFENENNKNEYT